jgi:hypothetical protein
MTGLIPKEIEAAMSRMVPVKHLSASVSVVLQFRWLGPHLHCELITQRRPSTAAFDFPPTISLSVVFDQQSDTVVNLLSLTHPSQSYHRQQIRFGVMKIKMPLPPTPRKPWLESPKDRIETLQRQFAMLERKEKAFDLRTTVVNKQQDEKGEALLSKFEQALQNEELIREKEDETRGVRAQELENMQFEIDRFFDAERMRKAKESLTREMFMEDLEGSKSGIAAKIQRLQGDDAFEVNGKRKLAFRIRDDEDGEEMSLPVQKKCRQSTHGQKGSSSQSNSPLTPDNLSSTANIPTSQTSIPETVPNVEGVDLRKCRFCGKKQPKLVSPKGKDITCECVAMCKLMWEIDVDSDEETVV